MPRQTGCLGTVRPACLKDRRQIFVAIYAVPCPAVPRKMHFNVGKWEGFQHDENHMGAVNGTLQTPP